MCQSMGVIKLGGSSRAQSCTVALCCIAAVSQNFILPRALSNDRGLADCKSAIKQRYSPARQSRNQIARSGVKFRVYAAIAYTLVT
jgi:hypothetical protein